MAMGVSLVLVTLRAYLSLPILSQSFSSTVIDSVLDNSLPARSKERVYKHQLQYNPAGQVVTILSIVQVSTAQLSTVQGSTVREI